MAEQIRNLRDLTDHEVLTTKEEAFIVSDYETGGEKVLRGPDLVRRLNFLREGILWGRETRDAADLIQSYLKAGCGTPETVAAAIERDLPFMSGTDWQRAWKLVEARQAMAQDPANRLET